MSLQIFEKKIETPHYEVDHNKKMRISTILAHFSEIAGQHCTSYGLSYDYLYQNGIVFVLSKVSVSVFQSPVYGQNYTIRTWSRGTKGVFFIRDLEMVDEKGKIFVAATSYWVIIDPIKRSILRPNKFPYDLHSLPDKKADAPEILKLSKDISWEKEILREVKYSDLDYNGHMTNSVYGSIICDALPLDFFDDEIKEFKINYLKEAKFGDTIKISRAKTDNGYVFCGNLSDKECFEAEIIKKI